MRPSLPHKRALCRKAWEEPVWVCSQLAGTVGWWLTRLIFRQIGTHR
jgi:hypothetical protein